MTQLIVLITYSSWCGKTALQITKLRLPCCPCKCLNDDDDDDGGGGDDDDDEEDEEGEEDDDDDDDTLLF